MVLPVPFPGSSMVEHSAVNRRVASSNLARGAKSSFSSRVDAHCLLSLYPIMDPIDLNIGHS